MSFFGEGRREQLEAAKNAITFPRLQVKLFNIIDNQDVFWSTTAVTLGTEESRMFRARIL